MVLRKLVYSRKEDIDTIIYVMLVLLMKVVCADSLLIAQMKKSSLKKERKKPNWRLRRRRVFLFLTDRQML